MPDKIEVASFDVDAQYGFTPLCPNELPVKGGDEIVKELNLQAQFAAFRVGSKDAHSPDAIWIPREGGPKPFEELKHFNADKAWPAHCIVGTPGFKLLPGLPNPIDYDYFVWKGIEPDIHPYGACYHDLNGIKSTGVIEFLRARKVNSVIVGGLATDYCVATTCRQLLNAGFYVYLNLAACRCIDEKETQAKLHDLRQDYRFGWANSAVDLKNRICV